MRTHHHFSLSATAKKKLLPHQQRQPTLECRFTPPHNLWDACTVEPVVTPCTPIADPCLSGFPPYTRRNPRALATPALAATAALTSSADVRRLMGTTTIFPLAKQTNIELPERGPTEEPK